MPLSPTEVEFMGGPEHLQEVRPPRRTLPLLHVKNGVYRLKDNCIHLVESPDGGAPQCDSHEDPNRSKACGDFAAGTLVCRQLRMEAGVDSPADFAAYLALTSQDSAPAPAPMAQPPMAA